jgi:hypothetical protein
MRHTAKVIGAALVLFAAAACGSPAAPTAPGAGSPSSPAGSSTPPPSSSAAPPPSTSPAVPTPPKQAVPPGDAAIPAKQVDTTGLPAGYPSQVFTSNGGTILNVVAEQGGCGHVTADPQEQNGQHIVVNLVETVAHSGQMCPDYVRNVVISVTLSAPLADRTVVLKADPHH